MWIRQHLVLLAACAVVLKEAAGSCNDELVVIPLSKGSKKAQLCFELSDSSDGGPTTSVGQSQADLLRLYAASLAKKGQQWGGLSGQQGLQGIGTTGSIRGLSYSQLVALGLVPGNAGGTVHGLAWNNQGGFGRGEGSGIGDVNGFGGGGGGIGGGSAGGFGIGVGGGDGSGDLWGGGGIGGGPAGGFGIDDDGDGGIDGGSAGGFGIGGGFGGSSGAGFNIRGSGGPGSGFGVGSGGGLGSQGQRWGQWGSPTYPFGQGGAGYPQGDPRLAQSGWNRYSQSQGGPGYPGEQRTYGSSNVIQGGPGGQQGGLDTFNPQGNSQSNVQTNGLGGFGIPQGDPIQSQSGWNNYNQGQTPQQQGSPGGFGGRNQYSSSWSSWNQGQSQNQGGAGHGSLQGTEGSFVGGQEVTNNNNPSSQIPMSNAQNNVQIMIPPNSGSTSSSYSGQTQGLPQGDPNQGQSGLSSWSHGQNVPQGGPGSLGGQYTYGSKWNGIQGGPGGQQGGLNTFTTQAHEVLSVPNPVGNTQSNAQTNGPGGSGLPQSDPNHIQSGLNGYSKGLIIPQGGPGSLGSQNQYSSSWNGIQGSPGGQQVLHGDPNQRQSGWNSYSQGQTISQERPGSNGGQNPYDSSWSNWHQGQTSKGGPDGGFGPGSSPGGFPGIGGQQGGIGGHQGGHGGLGYPDPTHQYGGTFSGTVYVQNGQPNWQINSVSPAGNGAGAKIQADISNICSKMR